MCEVVVSVGIARNAGTTENEDKYVPMCLIGIVFMLEC